MRSTSRTTFQSVACALVLIWYSGPGSAQTEASTSTENVTDDGLHRVNPSIMESAWVREDFDLSQYTRILLVPTAVQFRDVPERSTNARTRSATEAFPLSEERKDWFRNLWRESVESRFAREETHEFFEGRPDAEVLVVQALLVDVVSRIPPTTPGSAYTYVRNPWSAAVVLELRDARSSELLARSIDKRHGEGLMEVGAVWHLTEDLVDLWAQVLVDRLDQLSGLGGRSRRPDWAR